MPSLASPTALCLLRPSAFSPLTSALRRHLTPHIMPPHAIVKWALPAKLAKPFVLNQTAIDEESLQIPLGASFLVGILWFFFDWRVRKHASKTFGSVLDEDGMPRWRCASGVATQLLVLPALFGLSLASSGYSLSAWSETAGSAYFTEDGLRFYDWAFCYVFAAYMLSDVVLLKSTLSFLLKLHHVGCLIGTGARKSHALPCRLHFMMNTTHALPEPPTEDSPVSLVDSHSLPPQPLRLPAAPRASPFSPAA